MFYVSQVFFSFIFKLDSSIFILSHDQLKTYINILTTAGNQPFMLVRNLGIQQALLCKACPDLCSPSRAFTLMVGLCDIHVKVTTDSKAKWQVTSGYGTSSRIGEWVTVYAYLEEILTNIFQENERIYSRHRWPLKYTSIALMPISEIY